MVDNAQCIVRGHICLHMAIVHNLQYIYIYTNIKNLTEKINKQVSTVYLCKNAKEVRYTNDLQNDKTRI